MNRFFRDHPYMDLAQDFIIRVFSSSSTRQKFRQGDILVHPNSRIDFLLFIISGRAKVLTQLQFRSQNGKIVERQVQLQQLTKNSVFGQHFLVTKLPSSVKLLAQDRGQYAKVQLQQDIKSSTSVLSKRILETAARFPTERQIFEQYQSFLYENMRKSQALASIYPKDEKRKKEWKEATRKYKEIMNAVPVGQLMAGLS